MGKTLFPHDFKPWDGRRRRYRWRWGDPEILETDKDEIGCYLAAERLTVLHPHLRRREYHDLLYDTIGHETLHSLFPAWGHARIGRMERTVGQFLHDLMKCRCRGRRGGQKVPIRP